MTGCSWCAWRIMAHGALSATNAWHRNRRRYSAQRSGAHALSADKREVGAGDGLCTGRGEGNRHHFQPGIAAEIGVVVLRGDGAHQVGEKCGNLLEVMKDEVAREHRLAPGPALQGL